MGHTSQLSFLQNTLLRSLDKGSSNKDDILNQSKKEHNGYLEDACSELGFQSFYTGFFDFKLKLFLIPDYQNQEELINAIMVSLEQVERRFNVTIEDMEDVSNRLADAESLPLVIEELFIVPFYGQHTYLALVSSKDVEVTGIDALNIVNLISIFEWEMC